MSVITTIKKAIIKLGPSSINEISQETGLAVGKIMRKIHRSKYSHQFEVADCKVSLKGDTK